MNRAPLNAGPLQLPEEIQQLLRRTMYIPIPELMLIQLYVHVHVHVPCTYIHVHVHVYTCYMEQIMMDQTSQRYMYCTCTLYMHCTSVYMHLQWNISNLDKFGMEESVLISEVSWVVLRS